MNSNLFGINLKDILKGLIVAVFTGAALPVLAMLQTPNFNISLLNWQLVWVLAENGAVAGFASYIIKNFLTDDNGKFLGKI